MNLCTVRLKNNYKTEFSIHTYTFKHNIELNPGDIVVCDTKNGITLGKVDLVLKEDTSSMIANNQTMEYREVLSVVKLPESYIVVDDNDV